MCQVSPHQAIRVEKRDMSSRPTMMTAIDWETERPWVRNVLGDCQLLMLRLEMVQYPKKRNQSGCVRELSAAELE
jgi:hypothetical protein